MQANVKPRRILPRTTRMYGEKQFEEFSAQCQNFYPNMAPKHNKQRGGFGKDQREWMASGYEMGNSLPRETRKRRSPSPCRCEFCETTQDPRFEGVRLCYPQAWQLSRVSISQGQCPVCHKERGLRDLRRVSRRLFIGPPGQEDLWEDCFDVDGEQEPGRDQPDGPRILHAEQEEDRGVRSLVCQEEMPTTEEMGDLGYFPSDEPLYIEDSDLDEPEPSCSTPSPISGPLDMGKDWLREDYIDEQVNGLLSDLYDSS